MSAFPTGRRARFAAAAAGAVLAVGLGAAVLRPEDAPRSTPADAPASAADTGPPAIGGPGTCAGRALQAPSQLRGMWLTTVNNIDWPSRPGLPPETVKAEYRRWLDLAQRMHHNAVFVHVRPSGDALWPSAYAPWSQWLTGRLDGRHPGWDPMAFMVAEAHARNLEFHAWFNPYRGSQPAPAGAGGRLDRLAPDHPLRSHPDWAVVHPPTGPGSRLYFDPGIPQARRFVEDAMLEAVTRYDVDGVHFDDFFYPYPVAGQDFDDRASFARYGRGFARKADWRRDNVNRLVEEMSRRIKAVKPWVKFGISPFGIWRNRRTDPAGSASRGLQSYDAIYADTRLWVRRQWLDYVVPQLYWAIGFDVADYAVLLPWWARTVAGTRVQLYIGQADYRIGEKGPWRNPDQLRRQLDLNRRYAVSGSVHFSAKQVRADRLGAVSRYRAAHYGQPALVPPMPHLPVTVPGVPVPTSAGRDGSGPVTLRWRAGTGPAATTFAVYRFPQSQPTAPARLVGVVRAGAAAPAFVDRTVPAGTGYGYCVTALDRSGNQSRPAPALFLAE